MYELNSGSETQELLDAALKAHREYVESQGSCGKRFSVTGNPQLKTMLEAGKGDYALYLPGADLRGVDFSKVSWSRLAVADLQGADLQGARVHFHDRDCSAFFISLQNANLSGATLTGKYPYYDMDGANVDGACLEFESISLFWAVTVKNLATANFPEGRDCLPVLIPNPGEERKSPFLKIPSGGVIKGPDGRLYAAFDQSAFPRLYDVGFKDNRNKPFYVSSLFLAPDEQGRLRFSSIDQDPHRIDQDPHRDEISLKGALRVLLLELQGRSRKLVSEKDYVDMLNQMVESHELSLARSKACPPSKAGHDGVTEVLNKASRDVRGDEGGLTEQVIQALQDPAVLRKVLEDETIRAALAQQGYQKPSSPDNPAPACP